jgi:hypothetical protein
LNNTRTTLTAIVAVFIAATLVVGTFAATTMAQSAFAGGKKVKQQDRYMKGEQDSYKKGPPPQQDNNKTRDNGNDDDGGGGNGNGNTVTVQANKQKGSQSGWDNTQEQEASNLICTHPSALCIEEGTEAVNATGSSSGGDGHGFPGGDGHWSPGHG